MVGEDRKKQLAAVRLALDLGINYFDTAAGYGKGKSEINLGRILKETGMKVTLATKIRLGREDLADPKGATIASVERSLERLQRDAVDLIQIHNYIAPGRKWPVGLALDPEDVLGSGGVLGGFKELRDQGKVKYFGFTGIGEPQALHRLVESGEFHAIQIYFNLLNPSAGYSVGEKFSALNYDVLLDHAVAEGMGVLVIRVLALGALTKNPGLLGFLKASPPVLSLGSDFVKDVERAEKLRWMEREGDRTLPQAAIRFALMKGGVSSVLVGFSDASQLEEAVSCSGAGGLTEDDSRKLKDIWNNDFS
jgi:aryl-alcohol dehydrogenase-like predicted oxidoreductase